MTGVARLFEEEKMEAVRKASIESEAKGEIKGANLLANAIKDLKAGHTDKEIEDTYGADIAALAKVCK